MYVMLSHSIIKLMHCFVFFFYIANASESPPQETKIRIDVEYSEGEGLMY